MEEWRWKERREVNSADAFEAREGAHRVSWTDIDALAQPARAATAGRRR